MSYILNDFTNGFHTVAVFERGDQEEEVVQPKREIKERGNLSSARG